MESTVESKNELQSRISRFRDLHEQNPGARYFAPLADLLRQGGQYDEALRLLGEGLGRHDGYLAGLVIQGRTLQEMGRPDEAHETWQQVRRIDPDNLLALEFLADRAIGAQDWDRAQPLLEHLCRLLPDDSPWCAQLERIRAEAEHVRALRAERKAAGAEDGADEPRTGADANGSARTGNSFDTMTLVDIYLAQGYRDQALSVLERMLPGAGEGRTEILERIRLLQNVQDEEGEKCPAAAPATGPQAVATPNGPPRRLSPHEREQREEERIRRRDEERRQFEAWLARIRLDGEEN